MNRAERRQQNKRGKSDQPNWAQQGKSGQRPMKTNVQRGRHHVSQERGGAKS